MANPYIVIEQKDEKKKRGALAIILAIAFVAILAIGGTFAYLTYTANQTPNRFTTDPNITADVLEPTWTNAIQKDDETTTDTDEGVYASDGTAIPAAASNMMPSDGVAKNPFVVNTSKNGSDEYVGMKLQFQKWVDEGSGDGATKGYVNMNADEVAALMKVYAFATDSSSYTKVGDEDTTAGLQLATAASDGDPVWTQILNGTDSAAGVAEAGKANSDGAMYFYYTGKVEALPSTVTEQAADSTYGIDSTYRSAPLFTFVRYIDTAEQKDINTLNNYLKGDKGKTKGDDTKNVTTNPGWRVVISGAAIQATDNNVASDHAKTGTTENWIALLDANSQTDGSSTWQKPQAASGVRANRTLPEATNVNKSGVQIDEEPTD